MKGLRAGWHSSAVSCPTGISAVVNIFMAIALFVSNEELYYIDANGDVVYYTGASIGWGIFMLFVMLCNILALVLHIVFAIKCMKARAAACHFPPRRRRAALRCATPTLAQVATASGPCRGLDLTAERGECGGRLRDR